MNADRLRRLDGVLEAVLTREPTEWPSVLDVECSGDPELRREVEAMLARLDSAKGFLATPPGALAAALVAEETERAQSGNAREGKRIGAYRVVRELGRGGMARVFLAERADGQFEQQVALKLLRPGLDSDLDQERFRGERQILASLNHPHIAKLLDGGVTDDGVPYLVMEYVEGSPLDRYCESRNLSLAERLDLFLTIAEATQYAHRNLVVHRDLKPSNIMVTGDGTVKLLDFGLAKLLAPNASTPATRTVTRWMTPEYAAPEQVRGEAVSTLTDVYQLGVVFYELLSGRLPFADHSRGFHDLERAILDEEPKLPSVATRDAAAGRALRGDLDAIAMMALNKEPERRYQSALAMHDDIVRFRAGQTVSARPDGAAYRLRKFVRRNRAGVAAASVTVVALVAATIFSVGQAREAERQRDAAQDDVLRQNALMEIQGVIASDSRGPGGRMLSTGERIELAEQALVGRFKTEPWLVSEVLVDLSTRLYEIGEREAQRRILGRAASRAANANLPIQHALAECSAAYSLVYDDHLDSARAAIAHAWNDLKSPEIRSHDVAESVCMAAEGQLLVATQQPDSAIPRFERAVAMAGSALGVTGLSRLNDLAMGLRAAGRTRDAVSSNLRIAVELDSTGYRNTEIFPNALSFLAGGMWELGELSQLDSILRYYVRQDEVRESAGNTGTVLAFMYGLGKLRLGEIDSAELWFTRALRDTTQGAGGISGWTPSAFTQLRLEQGRLADAQREAAQLPGGTATRRVTSALLGSRIRYANGDRRGAALMLDTSLRAIIGDAPKPPPNTALALATAADWHLAAGDAAGADSLARLGSLAAAVDSLALERSAYVALAEAVRARALRALGKPDEARAAAKRAATAAANGFGAQHPSARTMRALLDSLTK